MVADAGPPLVVMAIGLVLWLAVTATVAGISIQTAGVIIFAVGAIWLIVEMLQTRALSRTRVVDDPSRSTVVEEPVVYRDRVL